MWVVTDFLAPVDNWQNYNSYVFCKLLLKSGLHQKCKQHRTKCMCTFENFFFQFQCLFLFFKLYFESVHCLASIV